MRRLVPVLVAALALAAVSVGFAWSATPRAAVAASRQPVHRVLWLGKGPSQSCDADVCGAGGVSVSLHMPGSGAYFASITMSFQYRTRGSASFAVDLRLGGHHQTLPGSRALAPSTPPNSTTVVFRTHLRGGRNYTLSPEVSAQSTTPTYSITTSEVLIELDATPSRPGAKLALEPRGVHRTIRHSPR